MFARHSLYGVPWLRVWVPIPLELLNLNPGCSRAQPRGSRVAKLSIPSVLFSQLRAKQICDMGAQKDSQEREPLVQQAAPATGEFANWLDRVDGAD